MLSALVWTSKSRDSSNELCRRAALGLVPCLPTDVLRTDRGLTLSAEPIIRGCGEPLYREYDIGTFCRHPHKR